MSAEMPGGGEWGGDAGTVSAEGVRKGGPGHPQVQIKT